MDVQERTDSPLPRARNRGYALEIRRCEARIRHSHAFARSVEPSEERPLSSRPSPREIPKPPGTAGARHRFSRSELRQSVSIFAGVARADSETPRPQRADSLVLKPPDRKSV